LTSIAISQFPSPAKWTLDAAVDNPATIATEKTDMVQDSISSADIASSFVDGWVKAY
jgi:hypothetical protein